MYITKSYLLQFMIYGQYFIEPSIVTQSPAASFAMGTVFDWSWETEQK